MRTLAIRHLTKIQFIRRKCVITKKNSKMFIDKFAIIINLTCMRPINFRLKNYYNNNIYKYIKNYL